MIERRKYLATAGIVVTGMIAGCSDSGESDREDGNTDSGPDDSASGENTEADSDDSVSDNEDALELLEHEAYNEGQFDVGVRGQLKNTSGEELSYVEVNVFFLNAEGVQVESGLDNTTDLAAGRTWQFDAAFLGDVEDFDRYEIKWEWNDY